MDPANPSSTAFLPMPGSAAAPSWSPAKSLEPPRLLVPAGARDRAESSSPVDRLLVQRLAMGLPCQIA